MRFLNSLIFWCLYTSNKLFSDAFAPSAYGGFTRSLVKKQLQEKAGLLPLLAKNSDEAGFPSETFPNFDSQGSLRQTPLIAAAVNKDNNKLAILLKEKSVPEEEIKKVSYLLQKTFAKKDADFNAKYRDGDTTLIAIVSWGLTDEMIYLLQNKYYDGKSFNFFLTNRVDLAKKSNIEYLVPNNVDVNAIGKGGKSALIVAAEKGYLEGVVVLLSYDDTNVNIKAGVSGMTALMYAVENKHLEVVDLLLKRKDTDIEIKKLRGLGLDIFSLAMRELNNSEPGNKADEQIDVVWKNWFSQSGAYYKSEEGLIEKSLDSKIANLLVTRYFVDTSSSSFEKISKKTLQLFVYQDYMVNKRWDELEGILSEDKMSNEFNYLLCCLGGNREKLLQLFARKGYVKLTKKLLEADPYINLFAKSNDGFSYTPLILAASGGHLELVKYLVEDKGVDIIAGGGDRALDYAASGGHFEVVKYFVEKGVDNIARAGFGDGALVGAAGRGHLELVKYFMQILDASSEIDYDKKILFKEKAMIKAAKSNCLEVVKYFVEERGVSANARDDYYKTTALMDQYAYYSFETFKYLVRQGADIDEKDKEGKTLLIYEASKDSHQIVKFLLSEKGLPDDEIEKVAELLQRGFSELGAGLNARNQDGDTLLIITVGYKLYNEMQYLLKQKQVNINARGKEGKTALMVAQGNRDDMAVDALLATEGIRVGKQKWWSIFDRKVLVEEVVESFAALKKLAFGGKKRDTYSKPEPEKVERDELGAGVEERVSSDKFDVSAAGNSEDGQG